MCEFKSAIYTRTGRLYEHPFLDSHEDLIEFFGLRDNDSQHFVRLEFRPDKIDELANVDAYRLLLDEAEAPSWWTHEAQENATKLLRGVIEKLISNGRKNVLGDAAIVPKGAVVSWVRYGRIVANFGTVQYVLDGGAVQYGLGGGTVQYVRPGGTVQEVRNGGTVQYVLDGGTVQKVWDGGTVQKVWPGGTVQHVWPGGTVQEVRNGGTVQYVWDGGTVVRNENEIAS